MDPTEVRIQRRTRQLYQQLAKAEAERDQAIGRANQLRRAKSRLVDTIVEQFGADVLPVDQQMRLMGAPCLPGFDL